MGDLRKLVNFVGVRMVPFIITVPLYFLLVTLEHKGEVWTTVLKCAPIISLMYFIHGIEKCKYSQRIYYGLVFSCLGDVLLNHDLFVYGMGAFGLAQICYISAFGLRPLKPFIGLTLYLMAVLIVSIFYAKLNKILAFGLPIYAFLLTTMVWRSLAQASYKPNLVNILCGVGSVLFMISDGCIAINRFHMKFASSQIIIMATYYAAQFAITLSIYNKQKSD